MTSIPAPVQQVLQARADANAQQVNTAVLKKSLDTQKQTGDAINELLSQAVDVQKQLASGHIDVRV